MNINSISGIDAFRARCAFWPGTIDPQAQTPINKVNNTGRTGSHGKAFYVLMERGKSKTDGFKSKLTTYSDKLRRKGVSGWEDIDSWNVQVLDASSVYFQMV